MYATAIVRESGRRAALFLPEEAIQDINGVSVVFVRRTENEFEARTVKTGQHADGGTEILEGLTPRRGRGGKGQLPAQIPNAEEHDSGQLARGFEMLRGIIDFALDNRWLVLAGLVALVIAGGYVLLNLPIDAFPDLTNNQVVVVTECPSMSSTEVDELVTYPIESALVGLPRVETVRSISKLGLSMVTLIFDDSSESVSGAATGRRTAAGSPRTPPAQCATDTGTHGHGFRRGVPVHAGEPEQVVDGRQDVSGLDAPVCAPQRSWRERGERMGRTIETVRDPARSRGASSVWTHCP